MKKLLLVLLVIVCIFIFGAESNQRKQWEYACFSSTFISAQSEFWMFNSSTEHYFAESPALLCDKIGIKRSGGKDESAVGLLMDYAGTQGWELVSVRGDKTSGSFWFKRQK
jgi:hypothetical protein